MDLQQYLQAIFANHGGNEYKRIGWQVAVDPTKSGLYKSCDEINASFKNIEDCKKHIENLSQDPTVISIWITPNSFSIPSHAEGLLSSIDWMFVDIDYTDIGKTQSQIDQFNLYPTMIVNSGKGLQIYWKLADQWTSEEWKEAQSGIRTDFNADNMVSRAGSFMRVPETFNRKHLLEKKRDEGYEDAYQCKLLQINNNVYTQDDFPDLTDQKQPESDIISSTQIGLPGLAGLNKIRQHCQVVDDAFNSIEDNDANNKPGHLKRLLAASMSKHTIKDEQYVLDLFSNCDDFNEKMTLQQYRSINQNPITCKKLQSSEWDSACAEFCPLMSDINKKSPIAFAYRQGDQLELTEDLLRENDSDTAFEEVVKRIKNNDNLLRRSKLIRQASAAYGIRETEIKQYLRDVIVSDERLPFIVNGKVDEVKASEFIIRKYNIIRYLEEFYKYNDGIWKRLPQEEAEALIHKEIREYSSNHVVSEVLCAVKRESLVTLRDVEGARDKFVVACNNGLLNVRTKDLTSFKPEDYRFQKMNANYDSNAKCPGFLKVVGEMFKGDSDANDKKMLLQEYMGYLLIPDYTIIKKMLYMWGPKANNGKSTVIDIIYALMGEAYIDSIPLNKLDGFMLNRLVGKHANIVADQDAMTKVPDGVFKQLVGGRDRITADVKYKDAINFKNTARLIFAVNKLPYSQAKDSGYYTRIVTLVFNNEFVVNVDQNDPRQMQANPEKIDAIIEHELDGILIWALEGLDRLLSNRKLTIPKSSVEALDEYRAENNSVIQFVKEECIIDPKRRTERTALYRRYVAWCEENGFLNKFNANTFFKTLESNYKVKQIKLNGVRQFEGIWHS